LKIEIQDLSFKYDGNEVLKNIDLSIDEGTFLGLMGPNGSGKTTLLRTMMTYLKPDRGAILVDSKPVHTLGEREVARLLAVVPQSSPTHFNFTAYEMVMMGRIPHIRNRLAGESKSDGKIVRDAMQRTDTWKFAERTFSSLSGGERQRVIIARALAQHPEIMLLDEPTVYLDIASQFEIMDLLKSLNEDGLTIVAVLHDLNIASRYCNEIALLHNGKLESFGSPEKVFTSANIARIFGIEMIIRHDPLTHAVSAIPRTSSFMAVSRETTVHVLCGGGTGGPVLNDLLDAGYSPSAGVVNVLDSDFETARDLRIPVISEIPFSQISDDSHAENIELVESAKYVIVTDFPVGPGNLRNIEAALHAIERGKTVFILNRDTISERDFVGGRAQALVQKLIDGGAIPLRGRRELMQRLEGADGK